MIRPLHEEGNTGLSTAALGDTEEVNNHEAEYISPHNITDTTPIIRYLQNSQSNYERASQTTVTALNAEALLENPAALEENRVGDRGEVVGYIQGYGPVTTDPNMSSTVVRGKWHELSNVRRFLNDEPLRSLDFV